MRRNHCIAVSLLATFAIVAPNTTRASAPVSVPALDGQKWRTVQTVPRASSAAELASTPTYPSPASRTVAHAVQVTDSIDLRTLLAVAVQRNPRIVAAQRRVEAAQARENPPGLRPDPKLSLGLRNFPVSRPGFQDFMTMKMIGISQMIPYPGKLQIERNIAAREVDAVVAQQRMVMADVEHAVQNAFYDLVFVDRALEVVTRNHALLVAVAQSAEGQYAAGRSTQAEVIQARLAATRLAEQAAVLTEQRRSVVAQLNALRDLPSETAIDAAGDVARVMRAVARDTAATAHFMSASLGARVTDSPFPSLQELQTMATRTNPELVEMDAQIATQSVRVLRARKDHLPDIDVMLEYGQRSGFSDMVSATVSIPLGVQKKRKQDLLSMAANDELSALRAEHMAHRNKVHADIARLVSEVERQRTQLALYRVSILPLAQMAVQSTNVSFQVGRSALTTVLEAQAALFNNELAYARLLSDFGKSLADLERAVGSEVLP